MSFPIQALVIGVTWAILLAVYGFYRLSGAHRLLEQSPVIEFDAASPENRSPGSWLSKAGVLWVFAANICPLMLVLAAPFFPELETTLNGLRMTLPAAVNLAGSIGFVAYSIWGLLVLIYNPNYTPLFQKTNRQYHLAVQGPYRLVRHPRYAAEALCNLLLFLMTGLWLPLLGVLAWPAVVRQAQAEEAALLDSAGNLYQEYRNHTGMFFPRF
ncbi:MAG TPA: methyltransferase [Anaerolineaceae bacterium]|nr:methyltransferase [Anaerolineaceae bacterium]HPN52079.1 methyltransferase [Anaerolineaceae bacterium]